MSHILFQVVHNEVQMRLCIRIREEVFINEQMIERHLELDEHDVLGDSNCTHYLLSVDGMPVGTARTQKIAESSFKIQRVAISKSYRKAGYGKILIQKIEDYLKASHYLLGAQEHAIAFYEKCGYTISSDVYIDANIRHRDMEKKISL